MWHTIASLILKVSYSLSTIDTFSHSGLKFECRGHYCYHGPLFQTLASPRLLVLKTRNRCLMFQSSSQIRHLIPWITLVASDAWPSLQSFSTILLNFIRLTSYFESYQVYKNNLSLENSPMRFVVLKGYLKIYFKLIF